MELEEMKNMWQQHDNLLQQNKMLSEKLINGMLKDKSKSAISKILGFEYLGLAVCGALILIAVAKAGDVQGAFITTCYFISVALVLLSMVMSFYKIRMLSNIDIGNRAVSETAHRIEKFRLFMVKERLWSLVLGPFMIIPLLAVADYWVYRTNLPDQWEYYLPRVVVALVLLTVSLLIVYRKLYFQNIRQLKDNLKEIEEFISGK